MGLCEKMNQDFTKEILFEIYSKTKNLVNPNFVSCYNQAFLKGVRLVPILSPSTHCNSINLKKVRAYTCDKICELWKGSHCCFCAKIGHIKNTCFKNKLLVVQNENHVNL